MTYGSARYVEMYRLPDEQVEVRKRAMFKGRFRCFRPIVLSIN